MRSKLLTLLFRTRESAYHDDVKEQSILYEKPHRPVGSNKLSI